MAISEEQIKKEIKEHIQNRGGSYSDWYVGISEEPRKRLFEEHGVNEKTDAWIYRQATSNKVARRIEKYFVDVLGTDGAPGGGDVNTIYVYAYKKKSHTNP